MNQRIKNKIENNHHSYVYCIRSVSKVNREQYRKVMMAG